MSNINVIAEIGINHNGDIQIAKKLIDLAALSGCNMVKIQKREPEKCVPLEMRNKIRETPWGKITYMEYKKKIEFNEEQIKELYKYSKTKNITFFASVWDIPSAELMSKYSTIGKVPSALITNIELCKRVRELFPIYIISTGMSTEKEIEICVNESNPNVIMHSNSTYPCPPEDLNLNYIYYLKKKYPNANIGYSGHELGLVTTFAAVAIGATWIERHITLDRTMWGSDQLSSIEPIDLCKLIKGIRDIEKALKYPVGERILFENEKIKRESLRG